RNPRTLLRKYLNQYTKRNTADYFIHKDLDSFLRRELDFYIKNEIMRLDDIENANVAQVETYLDKIKVLRKIGGQLITFLAQLEEFQKKLWLKKKFVTDTQYCITLDRIPEHFYPEIAANDAQRAEWVRLFAIDEIQSDSTTPAYGEPLTVDFLKTNQFLVLDTALFSDNFKDAVLAEMSDVDEKLDGLLIHSENFQALELMQEKYREKVKCIHIDPPYNTDTSGFLYKNAYRHSNWISMMENRIQISLLLMSKEGSCIQCHIDENEYERLFILFSFFGLNNQGTIIWDKANPLGGSNKIASQHEYVICQSLGNLKLVIRKHNAKEIIRKARELVKTNKNMDFARDRFKNWIKNNSKLSPSEKAFCELDNKGRPYQTMHMGAPEQRYNEKYFIPLIHPITKEKCPIPARGWSNTPEFMANLMSKNLIHWGNDEKVQPRKISYLEEMLTGEMSTVIRSGARGKKQTDSLGINFPYCHHTSIYEDLIFGVNENTNDIMILDYFAGSGTTGHAVVNLNREDGGKRKYIMVEMGNYFDTVLKPRMQKIVYSKDWKNGKPVSLEGISHAFKYIRLESYEDTLNNLSFQEDKDAKIRHQTLNSPENTNFRCEYMLKYWLDFETRGSPSLLNIQQFDDPTSYQLKLKKPGGNEYEEKMVDLVETFNWLIGLHVDYLDKWRRFAGSFKRTADPQFSNTESTRLILNGRMEESHVGKWLFRKVEGRVCRSPGNMNNTDRVLVIWRKLTENMEEDNTMLNEWFKNYRLSSQGKELNIIYVNASNNLQQLCGDNEYWTVRLIEETFHQRMWNAQR
ncbi:MAG: site-specific DNA-methyltransferase, partial [Salinispira sp.]